MKKTTFIKLLLVAVVVTTFFVIALGCNSGGTSNIIGVVDADDATSTAGIVYTEYTDGSVIVTDYKGEEKDIVVSATAGGGKTVIGIGTVFKEKPITSITLPDTVTVLDADALYNCTDLSKITAPGIARIGANAFTNTKWLASRPKDVLYYFNNVLLAVQFEDMTAADFSDVMLSTSTIAAQDGALAALTSMSTFTFPNTMYLSGREFDGITSLSRFTVTKGKGDVPYWKVGSAGELLSADGLHLYKYPEGSLLNSYTIPDTVKVIENYAFLNAPLTTITMGCTADVVGDYAFKNSLKLTNIKIAEDKGFKECGSYIFDGCTSLKRLIIPSMLTKIGNNAFVNSSLVSIEYQDTVSIEEIGKNAFKNLSGFTGVKDEDALILPDTLTKIGDSAFSGTAIEKVVLGKNTQKIGGLAFYSTPIKEIQLNEGLLTLGDSAFYMTGITEIVLPNSLLKIGNACFCESSLQKVYFGTKGNTSTDESMLEMIGANAFKSTNITSFEIPFSTTSIGSYSFAGCDALTSVTVKRSKGSEITQSGLFAFDSSPVTVLVTIDSVATYTAAYGWKDVEKIDYFNMQKDTYTYIFNTSGGGAKQSITYQSNSLKEEDVAHTHIAKDETPLNLLSGTSKTQFSKDKYLLEGWYKDPEFTEKVSFNEAGAMLTKTDFVEVKRSDTESYYYIELYAKWISYNITFNTQNKVIVDSISTNNPNVLLADITPQLEGSTFETWCYDDSLKLQVDVSNASLAIPIDKFTMATTTYKYSHFVQYTYYTYNITLYAKWRSE